MPNRFSRARYRPPASVWVGEHPRRMPGGCILGRWPYVTVAEAARRVNLLVESGDYQVEGDWYLRRPDIAENHGIASPGRNLDEQWNLDVVDTRGRRFVVRHHVSKDRTHREAGRFGVQAGHGASPEDVSALQARLHNRSPPRATVPTPVPEASGDSHGDGGSGGASPASQVPPRHTGEIPGPRERGATHVSATCWYPSAEALALYRARAEASGRQ